MDIKNIDYLAKHKQTPDEKLPLIQLGLYFRLRRIYEIYDYEQGNMTVEEAKTLKEKAIQQYESEYTAITEYDRLVKQNGEMMQKCEQYRKMLADDDRRRVAISGLMCEANKHGCEICKQIARFYDGH